MITPTRKHGGARPGAGRNPIPLTTRKAAHLKVYLPPDTLTWAKEQGGSEYVRGLIEQEKAKP